MPELLFLDCRPQQRSERAKLLEDSHIRSHVARQVHLRRRWRFYRPIGHLPPAEGDCIRPTHPRRGKAGQRVTDEELSELLLKREQTRTLPLLQCDLDRLAPIFTQVSEQATALISNALKVNNVVNRDFFCVMSDEAFYHVGAAFIKHEYHSLFEPGVQTREVLFHRVKALRIIQQRLQQSEIIDNPTLIAIICLPLSEDGGGSLEAFSIHWTGVSRLTAARRRLGDIRMSPHGEYTSSLLDMIGPTAKMMIGLDIPCSGGRTQEELINDSRPSPGDDEIERALIDSALPDGFRKLADEKLIGVPVLRLLRNYFRVAQYTMQNYPDSPNEPLAADFRHAYLYFHSKPSSMPSEPSIERLLYDALLVYTGRCRGPLHMAGIIARSCRQCCSRFLSTCFATRSSIAEENALYWAWTVIVLSWKMLNGDLSGQGLSLLKQQVRRFPRWTADAQASRKILMQFLYDVPLLHDHDRIMLPFQTTAS